MARGREWEGSSFEEVGGEGFVSPSSPPRWQRPRWLAGCNRWPRSSLRNRHLESGPRVEPPACRPPGAERRAGAARPPFCAPAAWLAAYFPSWQASRCRQGNACGELFILLKFAVGQEDVGGERQAAAGTVLFRSRSTCVV